VMQDFESESFAMGVDHSQKVKATPIATAVARVTVQSMNFRPFSLPRAFIQKRLHSLTGLWLVAFLILHLLANSQAALLVGEDGSGFVKAANDIRTLPYLPVIEIALLAVPFAIHIYWGICALMVSEPNSLRSDGAKPSLPEYPHNHAYTWQRVTSWILLLLIAAHVIQMRFMENPVEAQLGAEKFYMVRVNRDPGLESVAARLGVKLLDSNQIEKQEKELPQTPKSDNPVDAQLYSQQRERIEALKSRPLEKNQVMAVANNFGTAELLMVRETFKLPSMLLLYTVLVLSACFHGFNGLWTFLITWGVTMSQKSQNRMYRISLFFMGLLAFMGLSAIWGTYWISLRV